MVRGYYCLFDVKRERERERKGDMSLHHVRNISFSLCLFSSSRSLSFFIPYHTPLSCSVCAHTRASNIALLFIVVVVVVVAAVFACLLFFIHLSNYALPSKQKKTTTTTTISHFSFRDKSLLFVSWSNKMNWWRSMPTNTPLTISEVGSFISLSLPLLSEWVSTWLREQSSNDGTLSLSPPR